MQFVSREEAGLLAPRGQYRTTRSMKGTAVHWYGGQTPNGGHSECAVLWRGIQAGAFQRTDAVYVDIEYNLGACIHGYVFGGRGVGVIPAAQGSADNLEYYAVCALLGPSGGWTSPTDGLLNALCDAIEDFRQTGGAGTLVVPHRALMQTDCPGNALAQWVGEGARRPGSGGTPAPPPPQPGRTVEVVAWTPENTPWNSTLWGIAAHELGDGNRWPEIKALNEAEIQKAGGEIQPGMVLALPAH